MKTKLSIVTVTMLIAMLISACTPAAGSQPAVQATAQPQAPTIQPSQPPARPSTSTSEPTKMPTAAATQQVDIAATQQAFMRRMDQSVEATTAAVATGPNHFAGAWAGTMSFSNDPAHKEDVQVVIPQGCQLETACGYLDNTTVHCKWEITLTSVKGETLAYRFSKALSGDCPAGSSGTLTLQADGTLLREHKTPDFTASGPLTRQK